MLREHKAVSNTSLPNSDLDLYAERIVLGIVTGYYREFVDSGVVSALLRSQDAKLGCWNDKFPSGAAADVLVDVETDGGRCSLHASGLAGWVLAAYARYGL